MINIDKYSALDEALGFYYKVPLSDVILFENSLIKQELEQPICCVYQGEKTTFAGWYDIPVVYKGRLEENTKQAIFLLGTDTADLFGGGYAYYDVLLWLSPTRFFKVQDNFSGKLLKLFMSNLYIFLFLLLYLNSHSFRCK